MRTISLCDLCERCGQVFGWLLDKEFRELIASRAWWFLLIAIGPLVGVSFISAARTYAEASGLNGTADGVGEAFSPLVGVWAPTFSACELAAVFLLPFVAIRLMAGDRQSGALKIEAQHPMPSFARVGSEGAGPVRRLGRRPCSLLCSRSCCGRATAVHHGPEMVTIVLGHLLNAGLTIALAAAAAAVAEHPSTAAILTLSVTVGTWIVNFVAAVQGGFWERVAGYTPTAMVAEFQHGLLRLDAVLIAGSLTLAGLAFSGDLDAARRACSSKGVCESIALSVVTAAIVTASTFATASWDTSENRANSFSHADEEALEQIRTPLRIEAHLAPEDPRRFDLEHRALSKLRRVLPHTEVGLRGGDIDWACSSKQRRTTARSGTRSVGAER